MNGVNGTQRPNGIDGTHRAGGVDGARPKYGQRLLVNIIDERAKNEPNREFISVPRSSSPKDGWRPVTYKQLANAINQAAYKIAERCGPTTPGTFPTIAYIGPSDARYPVVTLAAVKAGCQALLISPRNSKEVQVNLFQKTDCHVLCYEATYEAAAQLWLQDYKMTTFMAEPLDAWFPEEDVPPFPYNKTFEEAEASNSFLISLSGLS